MLTRSLEQTCIMILSLARPWSWGYLLILCYIGLRVELYAHSLRNNSKSILTNLKLSALHQPHYNSAHRPRMENQRYGRIAAYHGFSNPAVEKREDVRK